METGSTLLYPLFNIWVPAYTQQHPNVQITTQGTGSGTGISEAVSGIAQIGASDAYMSNPLIKAHPRVLNIPLAISSQMINYNIPGLNKQQLKLSGPVLAGIYDGSIRFWDDPAIAKDNPGVKLPHNAIVPVHRTDGSGDTFIFTQYLSELDALLGKQGQLWQDGELAGGARRHGRRGQSRHGRRVERRPLFDRLCRHQLQERRRQGRPRRRAASEPRRRFRVARRRRCHRSGEGDRPEDSGRRTHEFSFSRPGRAPTRSSITNTRS